MRRSKKARCACPDPWIQKAMLTGPDRCAKCDRPPRCSATSERHEPPTLAALLRRLELLDARVNDLERIVVEERVDSMTALPFHAAKDRRAR